MNGVGTIAAALAAALVFVTPLCAGSECESASGVSPAPVWNPGEPCVTYWWGPGCPTRKCAWPLTDSWAEQLVEGGFNTAWASSSEDLDVAARHGLRAIYALDAVSVRGKIDIGDPSQRDALEKRIRAVKNHPALYVWEYGDEFPATRFDEWARMRDFVASIDPSRPLWCNLLPTYANNRQLGIGGDIVSAYWEYVHRFFDEFRPGLATWDHYQFQRQGDSPDYFLNMEIVRQVAASRGVPFWNGVQACSWVPDGVNASPSAPRDPGPDELRFLAHTTAAYGASGIYYFTYTWGGHEGFTSWTNVLGRNEPCETNAKFEAAKTINREFVGFARALRGMRFCGARFIGLQPPQATPWRGRPHLLEIKPTMPDRLLMPPELMDNTTLVTNFENPNDGEKRLMVVNCDYRRARTLQVRAKEPAERLDPLSGGWQIVGRTFVLALPPGGGALLRLRPTAGSPQAHAK